MLCNRRFFDSSVENLYVSDFMLYVISMLGTHCDIQLMPRWSLRVKYSLGIALVRLVVEVLEIIQYSALVVRSGYTGNVVVLRVVCTKW